MFLHTSSTSRLRRRQPARENRRALLRLKGAGPWTRSCGTTNGGSVAVHRLLPADPLVHAPPPAWLSSDLAIGGADFLPSFCSFHGASFRVSCATSLSAESTKTRAYAVSFCFENGGGVNGATNDASFGATFRGGCHGGFHGGCRGAAWMSPPLDVTTS